MVPEINKDGDSEEEPERKEAMKGIQIQEVNEFLSAGLLSPDLHKRLERFTAKVPEPQHILRKKCITCSKCPTCMEDPRGQTYYEILQADAFRAHVCRVYQNPLHQSRTSTSTSALTLTLTSASTSTLVSTSTLDPLQYRYKVKYITDPTALPLNDSLNYQVAYRRHLSLRTAFGKLEKPTQDEFTRRLTEGLLNHQYLEIVPESEAEQLRRPPGPGV